MVIAYVIPLLNIEFAKRINDDLAVYSRNGGNMDGNDVVREQ